MGGSIDAIGGLGNAAGSIAGNMLGPVGSFIGTAAKFDKGNSLMQGNMTQKGTGLLGWIQENPALTQGLLTSGIGMAAGVNPYAALQGGGESMAGVNQQIASRQGAEAAARQKQLENVMALRKLGVEESTATANILNMGKQLQLEQTKLNQEKQKQMVDTFEAAKKLGLRGQNLSNFVAQSGAGVMPIVQEQRQFYTQPGQGILWSGFGGKAPVVKPYEATSTMTARR